TFLASIGVPELLRVADVEGAAGRGSVPSYPAPEPAVRALARVVEYAAWLGRPTGRVRAYDDLRRDDARRLVSDLLGDSTDGVDLTREQAAELVGAYGIETLPEPPQDSGSGVGADDAGDGVRLLIESFEDPLF